MTLLEIRGLYNNNYIGLSCIENHVMEILQSSGYDIRVLCCSSYISFYDAIDLFLNKEASYVYFDGIPRLQRTMDEIGLAEIMWHDIQSVDLKDLIKTNIDQGNLLLITVDVEKCKEFKIPVRPLREDHYLCIYDYGLETVSMIDDLTGQKVEIKYEDLSNLCHIEVGVLKEKKLFTLEKYKDNITGQLDLIGTSIKRERDCNQQLDVLMAIKELLVLREAVGILRVSRKRVLAWLEWCKDGGQYNISHSAITTLKELVELIDKYYTKIEYFRLRRKKKDEELIDTLKNILGLDQVWKEKLVSGA